MGRRVLAAVMTVMMAAPLRGARAQAPDRDEQGRAAGQREGHPSGVTRMPGSTIWARNETEFAQALQSGAEESWVPIFDPRTRVTLTRTVTVRQTRHDGTVWGANGNFAKIKWGGPGGQDMIVYRGVKGVYNRGLYLEKFHLLGNADAGAGAACGACIKLEAPDGDVGSLYKFTLRDIYTANGTYGIVLRGAVFEGMCENVHAENHLKDGLYMEHTNVGRPDQGIVSNIQLIHPNMSRNFGAGVRSVYSSNIAFGSFVLNAEAGIVARDGLRVGAFNNGENTGEAVYVVPSNGYGSSIIYSEASTDGSTHARRFENGQWVSVGKPTLYLLSKGAGVAETGNHMGTYGAAAANPQVRVVK